MKRLLIDTAAPVVGMAVFSGPDCLWQSSIRQIQGADAWLGVALQQALQISGPLQGIAVVVGPGTFTGLRVGVATALGLALSQKLEVACISSLELRACMAMGEERVRVILDARKDHVYTASYDCRAPLPIALSPEEDIAPEALAQEPLALLLGEGAVRYQDLLAHAGHRISPLADQSPVAWGGALIMAADYKAPAEVALRYLRDPDVKIPKSLQQLRANS